MKVAPYEKGPAHSKNRSQRPEGKVLAGGYKRRVKVVRIQNLGEQQVVHMALMAGNIYQSVVASCAFDFLQALGIQLDAVEHIVPDPVENLGGDLDEGDAVVCADLLEVAVGLHSHFPDLLRGGAGTPLHHGLEPRMVQDDLLHLQLALDDRADDRPLYFIDRIDQSPPQLENLFAFSPKILGQLGKDFENIHRFPGLNDRIGISSDR